MTREIPLTKGLVAIVDDADFGWLSQWKWFAHRSGRHQYATRNACKAERADGAACLIYMHCVVSPAPAGKLVDHEDRNTLNNQRSNLRPATHIENGQNSDRARGVSGFRGVHFDRRRGTFFASLMHNRRPIYLGAFADPAEAARAYDREARKVCGAFARLNFPEAA